MAGLGIHIQQSLIMSIGIALLSVNVFAQADEAAAADDESSSIEFREVTESAGLNFVLDNHLTSEKHYIETMPGGVAAFDYNNDGLMDVYFTNGAAIPSMRKESEGYYNRLFRNDGDMKFTDVTAEAGLFGEGYSIAAAAGDFDNDGDADLFVAGVNRNFLYSNTGKGTFEDISTTAGIKSDYWAVAGGWFDYDNDGWLDLFVVNYVKWSIALERPCGDKTRNLRVYCHPKYFEELPNTLYRNNGDGTFTDVSEESGIADYYGRGMSFAAADYDLDGFMDVFVTNDYAPNFLFRNLGDGTFEETALLVGAAMRDDGSLISNMGSDFRDFDNDGWPDIVVVALSGQTYPLFKNLGDGSFLDVTYASQLGRLSIQRSGWSPLLVDLNNDGWKDLFVSCSHVNDLIERFEAYSYKLNNAVFENQGDGTFTDATGASGFDEGVPKVHRGSAVADFNNDGKMDLIVSALGSPAELWENTSSNEANWIMIKLEGVKSNRDGIGATIQVGQQRNHMTTCYGYASTSHQGVHFGLGSETVVDKIEIRWPSGIVQTLSEVKANQVLVVKESDEPATQ